MSMKHQPAAAFSLIEVAIALGVTVFCLVAIFGLLPIGLNSNRASIEQTVSASVEREIVSDLRATPITGGTSVLYNIPISTGTYALFFRGDCSVASSGVPAPNANADPSQNPEVRATVYVTAPAPSVKDVTKVRILVTWPALADPTAASAPIHFAGSAEAFTALDRN